MCRFCMVDIIELMHSNGVEKGTFTLWKGTYTHFPKLLHTSVYLHRSVSLCFVNDKCANAMFEKIAEE